MTYTVFHISPEGIETPVESFGSEAEADDSAEWLMDQRDWAQILDGTTFEARKVACLVCFLYCGGECQRAQRFGAIA